MAAVSVKRPISTVYSFLISWTKLDVVKWLGVLISLRPQIISGEVEMDCNLRTK